MGIAIDSVFMYFCCGLWVRVGDASIVSSKIFIPFSLYLEPPKERWVKTNFYGGYYQDLQATSVGVIIQDMNGLLMGRRVIGR